MENVNERKPIITLKNTFGHKDSRSTCYPVRDPRTGWYKGIEKLSEEEKKTVKFWIDPETAPKEAPVKEVITHNKQYDLNDPMQAMTWAWVQHHGTIAENIEQAQKSKAYFYVDNKDIEDKKAVDADDLLLEALTMIKEDRDENLAGRARVLGFNMEGESPTALRRFLNKKAKSKATIQQVYDAYTANSMAVQLLFYKAVDKDVITQVNGIFMFGTAPLGPSEESVVKYLLGPGNTELVVQIEQAIDPVVEAPKAKAKSTKPKTPKATKPEEKADDTITPVEGEDKGAELSEIPEIV
jgi:hypothetical protein